MARVNMPSAPVVTRPAPSQDPANGSSPRRACGLALDKSAPAAPAGWIRDRDSGPARRLDWSIGPSRGCASGLRRAHVR